MAIDALIKPLQALPLFEGLSLNQLGEIIGAAERIMYPRGSVIVAENTTSTASIIIISGACVRLNDEHGALQSDVVPVGSMIAELAMLVDVVHPYTIMARDAVRVLRITRVQMLALMERDITFAEHFSQVLVGRLKRVGEQLTSIDSQWERAANPFGMPRLGPETASQSTL